MFSVEEKIAEIRKATGLKIKSHKLITKGTESYILEINEQWIFRFPRNGVLEEKMLKRWKFLAEFSKVSPIPVPAPKYFGNNWVGYEKLSGTALYPTHIERLDSQGKLRIANQFGSFLRVLHHYKDKRINFDTGYLVMRKEDYLSSPKEFAKHLTAQEMKALASRLKKIAGNPSNFVKPTTIIHGDLNFNNVLWDKKKITGILDWSDMGLGIPAMDFIEIADFTKPKTDHFLRDLLSSYGAKDPGLFIQIKDDALIDVMNWFWSYWKAGTQRGMIKIIKKLKKLLAAD